MKTLNFTLFLVFTYCFGFAQTFHIDSLPKQGILLDKGWKWHVGDNPDFAKADFDDSAWESIDPTKMIKELKQINTNYPLWLRIKFDNKTTFKNILISIKQSGASEIFLNGKLINYFGKIDKKNQQFIAYDPLNEFSILNVDTAKNTLSVRYFFEKGIRYNTFYNLNLPLFSASLCKDSNYVLGLNKYIWNGFNIAVALILFLIHFIYFLSYTPVKTNLWYCLSSLSWLMGYYFLSKIDISYSIEDKINYSYCHIIFDQLRVNLLFITIFIFLKQKNKWLPIIFISITLISTAVNFALYFDSIWVLNFFSVLLYGSLIIYMSNNARKQGMQSGKYIILGMITYIIFWFLFILSFTFKWAIISQDIFFHISILVIPITMSALLGLDFKSANKLLINRLEKINTLSAEKQQILATQNEILEQQVEARTAELKASQNQLIQKEKLASLGELTAGIAHEIQNPLNFVNNFSELSVELAKELKGERLKSKEERDEELENELVDDLIQNQEKINHHGKRAASIVKGMLEHSKSSTGKKELTDINALVDEYTRLAYSNLRSKNENFTVDIETYLEETLPQIDLIPQDIGRVLLNLMNNAFWALQEQEKRKTEQGISDYKPTVTLSTKAERNQIFISVKDNGIGMSEATKAKIFQPFFTTKPTGEGTGLGLSLAYDIVTKGHGGTLEVLSTEGLGSEFIISLPFKING